MNIFNDFNNKNHDDKRDILEDIDEELILEKGVLAFLLEVFSAPNEHELVKIDIAEIFSLYLNADFPQAPDVKQALCSGQVKLD